MANTAIYKAQSMLGRCEALSHITATIDPSRWTSRKKGLITKAITDGIAACGKDTAWLVTRMVESECGESLPSLTRWGTCIRAEHIKPERLDDLMAYTAAWIRLRQSKATERIDQWGRKRVVGGISWTEKRFLEELNFHSVSEIPVNSRMTHKERHMFIREYIVEPDTDQQRARDRLVERINNDEPITFVFANN
jgi:hypothetical protein